MSIKFSPKNYFSKISTAIFFVFAIFMVALSIAGGIKSFSSVPYMDMWGPYLDIYMEPSGRLITWWSQHNEHRIVLSRVLFWLDIRYFGGLSYFLIFLNYMFVVLEVWIFFKLLKEKIKYAKVDPTFGLILRCFIVAWLFSWSQYDNLTWAFQSQFFLAQLLPLCCFYCFSKSISDPKKIVFFIIAILFGVLALGSMANGIFTLPLLFFYSLISSQSRERTCALFLLAILSTGIYLFDYLGPVGHGSPLLSLISTPGAYLHYVLNYLGVPFYFLFEGTWFAERAAIGAGIFILLFYFIFAIKMYKTRDYKSVNAAIIFFGIYILATAIITGGGRLMFGVNQALTSRDCTPTLMMWLGLLILIVPLLYSFYKRMKIVFSIIFILVCVGLIPMQLKVLKIDSDINFNKEVAALALSMGVRDFEQISKIYPAPEVAIAISERAKNSHLSIFGSRPYGSLGNSLNITSDPREPSDCIGSLDEVSGLNGSEYSMIKGWIYAQNNQSTLALVQIMNMRMILVGYAIVGQRRDDVMRVFGPPALKSGFVGYVKTSEINAPIRIGAQDLRCTMVLRLKNND